MSFAFVSLLILVVIVIIATLILLSVFARAAGRNPNRPGGESTDEHAGDTDEGPDRGRQ